MGRAVSKDDVCAGERGGDGGICTGSEKTDSGARTACCDLCSACAVHPDSGGSRVRDNLRCGREVNI